MIMKKTKKLILCLSILLLCQSVIVASSFAATKKGEKVAFNFVDVEITSVAKLISDITGKNFVFDEKVKGKITIVAPSELSVDAAYNLFTSVLEVKGFTVVPSGVGVYKIVPAIEAKQRGLDITSAGSPGDDSYTARLIPLNYISSGEALKFLQPIVSKDGHISAFGPGNLLLVIDSGLNVEKIVSLVKSIDRYSEAQGRVNVYFLENADSTELAKVLEGVLKGMQGSPQRVTAGASIAPFEAAITPDKATNSLVIVALPEDYQNLLQVIKQLDRRRKQVFVEAMIVEASIDKLKELGATWRGIARKDGDPFLIGGVGTMDTSAVTSIINGMSGLTLGGFGDFMSVPVTKADGTTTNITVPGFAALFSLSEFKGSVNILSTPQILTSDNEEAIIVVGENVPFISKREADPSRALSVFSTIERKDIGITLKITPQITEGDYVRLDIYQEISSLKQDSENLLISVGPSMTKRSTKTSVTVKDNQTVVIGGLMQEKDDETITKVPLLGDIPILGWLFKSKRTGKKKTNLMVFLTPSIIRDVDNLATITDDKNKEFGRSEKTYAKGELIIKFKKNVTVETALRSIADNDASLIKFIEPEGFYQIAIREGDSVEDEAKVFSAIPEVEYAEPNYRIEIK